MLRSLTLPLLYRSKPQKQSLPAVSELAALQATLVVAFNHQTPSGGGSMRYSTKAIRQGSAIALALIGLLQFPAGSVNARRERVVTAQARIASPSDHERSFSRTPERAAGELMKMKTGSQFLQWMGD